MEKSNETNTKKVYSECLLCLFVLRVLCCSKCLFLCRPFWHGSLKLDLSTLFAKKFFEHISPLHGCCVIIIITTNDTDLHTESLLIVDQFLSKT